jgi:hypothetical protein
VRAELIHVVRRTNTTKLIDAFRVYVHAPKMCNNKYLDKSIRRYRSNEVGWHRSLLVSNFCCKFCYQATRRDGILVLTEQRTQQTPGESSLSSSMNCYKSQGHGILRLRSSTPRKVTSVQVQNITWSPETTKKYNEKRMMKHEILHILQRTKWRCMSMFCSCKHSKFQALRPVLRLNYSAHIARWFYPKLSTQYITT